MVGTVSYPDGIKSHGKANHVVDWKTPLQILGRSIVLLDHVNLKRNLVREEGRWMDQAKEGHNALKTRITS